MATNRSELAKEYAALVLGAIEAEDKEPMRPKKQVLVTLSVRMTPRLKQRLERASKRKGVQQTQLVRHALVPILAVIMDGGFPEEGDLDFTKQ